MRAERATAAGGDATLRNESPHKPLDIVEVVEAGVRTLLS
jgi:hypothetical protein